jgi:hypothetical protein
VTAGKSASQTQEGEVSRYDGFDIAKAGRLVLRGYWYRLKILFFLVLFGVPIGGAAGGLGDWVASKLTLEC